MKLVDYYNEKYAKEIKDTDSPLFVAYVKSETGKKDREVLLVPELMKLTSFDQSKSKTFISNALTSFTKINANGKDNNYIIIK